MNKKFLSVVLFGALMAGSSVTFTGCIDNDEPAGIENLRGAKAELLRAKVAVETAEAALRNAYAAEHLAQAKWTEAMAAKQELENEEKRLKNEVEAAKTEAEKAYWAAELARVEADLAKNKLTWEADRLAAETVLAQARKDYEDAMKAIELSKNYLSEAELGQLNYVQGEYSYAYAKLYSGSYTRYTASVDKTTGKVTWSPKDDKVDKENSAKGILEAAYDTYESDVNAGNFGNISEIKLNAAVAEAKTTLEVTVAELGIKKEALAALESSETLANWKKVKAEYKAKQDSLNDVVADKTLTANKIVIENREKAYAMQEALQKASQFKSETFKNGAIAEEKADFTASEALKSTLAEIANELNTAGKRYLSYDKSTNIFSTNLTLEGILSLQEDKGAEETESGCPAEMKTYQEWENTGAKMLDNTIVFVDGEKSSYKEMNDAINAVIEILNEQTVPSINEEEAKAELDNAKAELKKLTDTQASKEKTWTDAIEKFNKSGEYNYKTDLNNAKAAINAYVEARNKASKMPVDTDEEKKAKWSVEFAAQTAFAKALVTYYTAVNNGIGSTLNTISLKVNKAVGSGTELKSNTVLGWLSGDNAADYLVEITKYFNGTTDIAFSDDNKANCAPWLERFFLSAPDANQKEMLDDAKENIVSKASSVVASITTVEELQEQLNKAAIALYGEKLGLKSNGTGRTSKATDEEIKKEYERQKAENVSEYKGLYIQILNVNAEIKMLEDKVNLKDQFAAVVKALEEVKATIAAAKVDFMAEAKELIDAASAAQKECADNINAPIQELGIEADLALSEKIGNVIDAVEGSVGEFDTDWADEELLQQTEKYIALIGNLKTEIKNLQETTIPAAESALIKAEAMLDAYKNGNMSAQHVIEWAQAKVDNAKANYEAAVKELTYWTDKVQEVTAALYGKVAE